MYRRLLFFAFFFSVLGHVDVRAQSESTSVFHFLTLPTSAHAMALGGLNFTIPDDDASLFFQNPALTSNVSDRSINFSFLSYMRGSKAGNVSWVSAAGDRGTWFVGAQFVGYGSMKEMSVDGVEMGDFSALDMAVTGGYSYTLTDHLAGGATGKFVYSKYGPFTSVALAVDLGLNYYDEDKGLSLSAVAANLGWQVKAFGDRRERIPFDLRLGFSKELANAPIRFSVSMVDLTRWKASDYYAPGGSIKSGAIFMNHFLVGVDILPSDLFYLSAGYNFRRARELKAAGGSHGAGLSFGAGLNLKRFRLGLAYAKYHLSVPSFMLTAQYSL
ncbi:MAG: type IX secretion system protein PorQ [Bacteroidaceae bacterium]|nr:type IX secretion system protein PorQ [Bacteroidaceae bacterium]